MVDDGLCQNCGRCCLLKVQDGQYYKLTSEDCRFLERHPNGKTSCRIYNMRGGLRVDEMNVCVPINQAIKFGDLPMDCPYTMGIPGYKTNVIDWMGLDGRS